MRKQKQTILWPVYFALSKTRKKGRKVPKSVAVPNPNLMELRKAAERLGLRSEAEAGATHPAIPWQKTGRIWVQKKATKTQTLMKMAREIVTIRKQKKK